MADFTFSLDNPDEMVATIRYTMKVKDWKELLRYVSSSGYAGNSFTSDITDMIRVAEKHFNSWDVDKLRESIPPKAEPTP